MNMKLITQGLRITTHCRYIKFTQSKYLNIFTDEGTSCLHIEFPKGFLSTNLVDTRIEVLNPTELQATDFIKIYNPIIDLNGIKITKLIQHDYSISQYVVKDITEFVMSYDEFHCDILIPKSLNYRLDKYVELINRNPYLEVVCSKKLQDLRNFYSINITTKDIKLESTNKFEFSTKSKYTKYLLDMISIQDSFITQLESLLKEFGLELVSLPIDQNIHSVHRVTYRYTDIGRQISHKTDSNPLRWATEHTAHVEFKISTPDMVLYNDFKNRYQNLDLISNFTQFYTADKVGRNWLSSVFWSPMDTSFNQDYSQDEQGNVAFEAAFYADIDYWVVYDETYYNIQSIILEIESNNSSKIITKI